MAQDYCAPLVPAFRASDVPSLWSSCPGHWEIEGGTRFAMLFGGWPLRMPHLREGVLTCREARCLAAAGVDPTGRRHVRPFASLGSPAVGAASQRGRSKPFERASHGQHVLQSQWPRPGDRPHLRTSEGRVRFCRKLGGLFKGNPRDFALMPKVPLVQYGRRFEGLVVFFWGTGSDLMPRFITCVAGRARGRHRLGARAICERGAKNKWEGPSA